MNKIGEYTYPSFGTFADAMTISKKAIENFGGVIPIAGAAKLLGYKISDKSNISGSIYKRFNELESFGLFTRDSGGLLTTDLAKDALHPNNEEVAKSGKIKAIRNITIVGKAFDTWHGVIPDISAFPGQLSVLVGISWPECRKHSEPLHRLFSETFPHLGTSTEIPESLDFANNPKITSEQIVAEEKPKTLKGELKTTIGSVIITDNSTLNLARKLLDVFEEQLIEAKSSSTEK